MKFKETKLTEKQIRKDGEICHYWFDKFAPLLDIYTKNHCERVSAMSYLVMERIVSRESLSYSSKLFYNEAAKYGGLLHDIGKSMFPKEFPTRLKTLTAPKEENYSKIIKKHPIDGFNMILNELHKFHTDEFILMVMDTIIHHHERIDGDNSFEYSFKNIEVPGYPHGLKGEDIPPPARVLYVVDYFDAAVTRGQKHRLRNEIIDWICAGKGTYYDPVVVDAFLDIEKDLYRMEIEADVLIVDDALLL